MCNPPYKDASSFVEMCERACVNDARSKALLILPHNEQQYCQTWCAANRWWVCYYIEKGAAGVFSRQEDRRPFHLVRENLQQSVDNIMACVYRRAQTPGPTISQ